MFEDVLLFSVYSLLKSFIILFENLIIKRQKMTKMNDRVLINERPGSSRLNQVFLKIYSYQPSQNFWINQQLTPL